MIPSRTETITTKVPTKFGSLYTHVSHASGKVVEIAFSSPGKFADTAIGDALNLLAQAVNTEIAGIMQ